MFGRSVGGQGASYKNMPKTILFNELYLQEMLWRCKNMVGRLDESRPVVR